MNDEWLKIDELFDTNRIWNADLWPRGEGYAYEAGELIDQECNENECGDLIA